MAGNIDQMSDERLLDTRICDLDLEFSRTIRICIKRLFDELDAKGLHRIRPTIYLGDEWFSPDGVAAISIPFYLTHARLRSLEKKQLGRIEGTNFEECMKLMRHEMGHCFDHGYRIRRNREWLKLFGSSQRKYSPSRYAIHEQSRDFVQNLSDHYAQSHPDEDFAETFAVWLSPEDNWRRRYAKWPRALDKLLFIDKIAKYHCEDQPQARRLKTLPGQAARLRSTLSRFYDMRKRSY